MNVEMLRQAGRLAAKTGVVFVATSDAEGLPHVATAGQFADEGDGLIAVSEWFCPGTVANLRDNPRVAVVIWEAGSDAGFQLLGQVAKVEDMAVLDGYDPAMESAPPPPQVRRRLLVCVDKVLRFSHAPHSDTEE